MSLSPINGATLRLVAEAERGGYLFILLNCERDNTLP
jgi:hypothetical protein